MLTVLGEQGALDPDILRPRPGVKPVSFGDSSHEVSDSSGPAQ